MKCLKNVCLMLTGWLFLRERFLTCIICEKSRSVRHFVIQNVKILKLVTALVCHSPVELFQVRMRIIKVCLKTKTKKQICTNTKNYINLISFNLKVLVIKV